jgi:hypothetical protein
LVIIVAISVLGNFLKFLFQITKECQLLWNKRQFRLEMERMEHERVQNKKRREDLLIKVTELKLNYKYYDPSQYLSIDEEQALGQAPVFNSGI